MSQETEAQANDVGSGAGESPTLNERGELAAENGQPGGQTAPQAAISFLEQYKPSGRVTLIGILLMPILGAGGAYLGSWLYALFFEHLCTLIVVFPLITGGIAGAGVGLGVRWGKIRNTGLAMLVGLAAGLLAFGMTYSWGYNNTVELVRSHLLESKEVSLAEAEARELLEQVLMEDTGHTGLYGYFLFRVQNSSFAFFRLGRNSFDAYEVEKSPAFISWVVTILNFLAAGAGGLFIGAAFTAFPFCEQDKRWHRLEIIFGSSLNSADDLMGLLLDGRYGDMLELLEPPSKEGRFSVDLQFCPVCRNGILEGTVHMGKEHTPACRLAVDPEQVEELLNLQKDATAALKAKEEEKAKEEKIQEAGAEGSKVMDEKSEEAQ